MITAAPPAIIKISIGNGTPIPVVVPVTGGIASESNPLLRIKRAEYWLSQ